MKNRLIHRSAGVAAALLLLAVSACGGDDSAPTNNAAEEPTQESPTAAAATVATSESDLGTFLVDDKGMTLYMFVPDKQSGKSTCEGDCLAAWPPYEGPVEAGGGVDASLLGTTKAADGTTMVTYNDWPLYYYVDDKQAGDVTGQGASDVWWVMGPDGEPIEEAPAAAGPTLETAKSDLGTILVDSEGMTLYMFDPDEQTGKSVCDAECLKAWPPYEGPVKAGEGVDKSLLGTTKATDGTTMVTYNDWPLYYWVDDKKAGDVTGQAVGDVWWVMGPDGKPIRKTP